MAMTLLLILFWILFLDSLSCRFAAFGLFGDLLDCLLAFTAGHHSPEVHPHS
jgi:hypothetical protein